MIRQIFKPLLFLVLMERKMTLTPVFEVWQMMVRQIVVASIAMVINQVSLAEAASTTSASLDRPPPRPLRLLPSPPPKSRRRQVIPWRGWTRRPSPPSMHNVLSRLYVFLSTKQAGTNICWMIYQDIDLKKCLSLFGWKENIQPKQHIVH